MLQRTSLVSGWTFAEKSWQDGAHHGLSELEWLPAEVPGHVHCDLVRNGVIGDPFERMQELGCRWVDEADFSYRLDFEAPADPRLPRRILRFEGLDTICTVWLDGEQVAEHDNMFLPLEIDVSDRLGPGKHELRVDFASALAVGRKRRQEYFAAEGLPPDTERFDERALVRKAQFMYGWDWGPRLVSAGLWRPVWLIEYQARLLDVHVQQAHLDDGSVRLTAKSQVEGSGTVWHWLEGEPAPKKDGLLAELSRPKLWYPNGLGAQPLLTLTSYLCPSDLDLGQDGGDPETLRMRLEAAADDIRTQRIGLRRIGLVRRADTWGESFELEVNGRALWALGANFIPHHSFPSLVSESALRRLLTQAKEKGFNLLRVWGGGLYESDLFYDLCDELGLLVWQDFPFACSYYPDTGVYREKVRVEARENVRRLRNHPSLALWCGNNENLTMRDNRWGERDRHPPRYFGEHLFDELLPSIVRELDPERPYIPTSPHGGEPSNCGGIGDQHYWDVWHGRGDWIHYRDSTARFCSEFGFASACSRQAFERILPDAGRDRARLHPIDLESLRDSYRDPVVRWHDKTGKGTQTFVDLVELHYPKSLNLDDWIYHSQLNQRDAIRAGVEHFRRSEFCKGALIWQLNDCWPVQSWALIDSLDQPKAAFYELARLFAPGLLSLVRQGSELSVWVVLDNQELSQQLRGKLTLSIYHLPAGQLLQQADAEVSLQVGERARALCHELGSVDPQPALAVARLGSLSAAMLLCEPKSLRLGLPAPLGVSLADGALVIETPTALVDLVLSDQNGCARFLDNALTFAQPGRYQCRYQGQARALKARSLAGVHPVILG